MRLHGALLLLLAGTSSAATFHPTLTFASASDVAVEPLSIHRTALSLQRWSNTMKARSMSLFFPEKVFRPEWRQGETPPEYRNDFDEAVQAFVGPPFLISPLPPTGFEGIGDHFPVSSASSFQVGAEAPDTSGAPGVDQFVQIVNQSLAVFGKDGTLRLGPMESEEIWRDFDGECGRNGSGVDAVVLFDHFARRWFITSTVKNVDHRSFQCVAVSRTADATGIYARYEFPFGNLINDYPKFAVWPDAYYATYDLFEQPDENQPANFKNTRVCAYDRAAMLAAAPKPAQLCVDLPDTFQHLLPSDMDGPAAQGATPPNFIVGLAPQTVNLWRYKLNWSALTTSTLDGPFPIAVKKYQWACTTCVPQKGSSTLLFPMGDRPMFRASYRTHPNGTDSLVVDHAVRVVKHGVQDVAGIRWYEITNPGITPVVSQQATYSPDTASRWMPSMAMDKLGDIALGFSLSSRSVFPAMYVTGRAANQPPSELAQEAMIKSGTDFKPAPEWGDYSHMSIDPLDDCTFWFTSEYLGSPDNLWHTYISFFKFNGCS